jgi:hypothetical protein
VQRLTDLMWFGHSSTEEDGRVYRLARVLTALRQSLVRLRKFYQDIGAAEIPPVTHGPHSRFYPYPTSYTDNGVETQFKYTKMLEEDAVCVTYRAKICDQVDSPDIVVKFVTRYGEEVHKFLADHNYAPRLRYCGPLSGRNVVFDDFLRQAHPGLSLGPIQMVVMDYVSVCKRTPPDAHQQVAQVLDVLHSAGYVFGDLREQNILFDEENKVKFIDFDWCGRYDINICDNSSLPSDLQKKISDNKKSIEPVSHYVCYPLNLSKVQGQWVEGVKDLEPIRPKHDWAMLAKLRF